MPNWCYSEYIATGDKEQLTKLHSLMDELEGLKARLKEMTDKFEASMNRVKEAQNQEYQDFVARRLMEMAADCIMGHLLIQDATKAPELFSKSAHVYVNYVAAEVEKHNSFIQSVSPADLVNYK